VIRPAGLARGAVFLAVAVAFPFVFGAHWVVNMAIFTLMYAALATAWNMFAGYSGYISLGHVAFFGMGAYATAIVFAHTSIGSGYKPFWFLPVIGIGVGLASVPVGWIALRTRAITFAIVTLTLLFVFQNLATNLRSITHGSSGYALPVPTFAVATYERPFYFAMLGVLVMSLLFAWQVRNSKLGLMLFAIREDEDKARGLGVRTTGAKSITFALSAGLTAMAGSVWAYYLTYIYPQYAVDPLVMIGSVLPVFLGGRGTLWGPILGALILVPAQQYLAYKLGASELYLVGYSAVFVAILLLLPQGIIPSVRALAERWRYRGARLEAEAARMKERVA
jgi:branched-chain amino acid transport system permease protein